MKNLIPYWKRVTIKWHEWPYSDSMLWKLMMSALVLVKQLWKDSHHIFLKELSKYTLRELFQRRKGWPQVTLPWHCAVHCLCCRPVPDHRKAPLRISRLCWWPPPRDKWLMPVFTKYTYHVELGDFQHINGEQQGRMLDCWKKTAARTS